MISEAHPSAISQSDSVRGNQPLRNGGEGRRSDASSCKPASGLCQLNRCENSYSSFRRRGRAMLSFRRVKTLPKFALLHANVHNHFVLAPPRRPPDYHGTLLRPLSLCGRTVLPKLPASKIKPTHMRFAYNQSTHWLIANRLPATSVGARVST